MTRRIGTLIAGAVMLAAIAACDPFAPLGVLTDEQLLENIVFTPDSADVHVGDSVQVTVKKVGKGGGTISSGTVVLTVGNPLYVSVSNGGYVKGLRVGTTEVLGTLSGRRGSAIIRVIP